MRNRCISKTNPIAMLLVLLAIILAPEKSIGGDLISGRYLKASGKRIVVELNISAPPPPLIIVVQKLPKGTEIKGSTPEIKKYNPGKGIAKWLLRDIQPGKLLITMHLNNSMQYGDVNGEIRCRDKSGRMINMKIRK